MPGAERRAALLQALLVELKAHLDCPANSGEAVTLRAGSAPHLPPACKSLAARVPSSADSSYP